MKRKAVLVMFAMIIAVTFAGCDRKEDKGASAELPQTASTGNEDIPADSEIIELKVKSASLSEEISDGAATWNVSGSVYEEGGKKYLKLTADFDYKFTVKDIDINFDASPPFEGYRDKECTDYLTQKLDISNAVSLVRSPMYFDSNAKTYSYSAGVTIELEPALDSVYVTLPRAYARKLYESRNFYSSDYTAELEESGGEHSVKVLLPYAEKHELMGEAFLRRFPNVNIGGKAVSSTEKNGVKYMELRFPCSEDFVLDELCVVSYSGKYEPVYSPLLHITL